MAKHPAVFLDRDGTLIKDKGYLKSADEVEFYPETLDALSMLQEEFLLFIITNQSGVGKGITSLEEVNAVNKHLVELLKKEGIAVFDLYCCPHASEDNCECKKPSPYFVQKAAKDYRIDLSRSYIVGDHPSDVDCGINAGITPVYLLTGHGEKHLDELASDVQVCQGIMEATRYIFDREGFSEE